VTVTPGVGGAVDLTIPSAEPQFKGLFSTLVLRSSTAVAAVGPTTPIFSFSTVAGNNYSYGYNFFMYRDSTSPTVSAAASATLTPIFANTTTPGGAGSNAGLVRAQCLQIAPIASVLNTNAGSAGSQWIQAGQGFFQALGSNATLGIQAQDPGIVGGGSQTGDIFTPSSILLQGQGAGGLLFTYAYIQPLGNLV